MKVMKFLKGLSHISGIAVFAGLYMVILGDLWGLLPLLVGGWIKMLMVVGIRSWKEVELENAQAIADGRFAELVRERNQEREARRRERRNEPSLGQMLLGMDIGTSMLARKIVKETEKQRKGI
jgi:hypothetical protein